MTIEAKTQAIITYTHSPLNKLSLDPGLQLTEHLEKNPDHKISKIDSYVVDDIAYITVVFTN